MCSVESGNDYIHYRNKKVYTVESLGLIQEQKNWFQKLVLRQKEDWVISVNYTEKNKDKLFTRQLDEFKNKFNQVVI